MVRKLSEIEVKQIKRSSNQFLDAIPENPEVAYTSPGVSHISDTVDFLGREIQCICSELKVLGCARDG